MLLVMVRAAIRAAKGTSAKRRRATSEPHIATRPRRTRRSLPPEARRATILAAARGELPDDALARFPQLIVAPMLVGIIWHALFDKFEPLDVGAMARAHVEILFVGRAA